MKTPPSSNKNSDWQSERAAILHGLFSEWHAKNFSGKPLNQAIRRASRRLNGKPYESDPLHNWAASTGRLYQLYRKWQHGGQVPSALNLNYGQVQKNVSPEMLIRFVNFWAARDFEFLHGAWEIFCLRGGNFGRGRFRGVPLKLGCSAAISNLPAGFVREMVRAQKAKNCALAEIKQLRISAQVEIKSRVPAKLQTIPNFEI